MRQFLQKRACPFVRIAKAQSRKTVRLRLSRLILALCVFAICAAASTAQEGKSKKSAAPPTEDFSRILSWFPADTETIVVANGTFSMPDLSPRETTELPPLIESVDDLKEDFEALPLGLLGFKSDLLSSRLQGQKITFAIEGARHFRNPEGLGTAPFEGCSLAVFARDISDRTSAFLANSAKAALPSEQIEDQKIAVFQEILGSDTWTIYVDFPKPNMALACTNRDFLREVLVRMRGARGAMALPDQLPEWKYIDTRARFWGFRHFDKSQEQAQPQTAAQSQSNDDSPFTDADAASNRDAQATGITFRFDPNKSRTAVVTYFSADAAVLKELKAGELSGGDEAAVKNLRIEFSELAPGIVAITYDLESPDSVNLFRLILGASLGHSIFL
jgi:hypothetical protein